MLGSRRLKNTKMNANFLSLEDLARERVSYTPDATYDHELQQLIGANGVEAATSNKDEDAGGSTTFWDGERQ